MPGINEDRERQVVPRWRDFDATCSRGELAPLRSSGPSTFSDEMLEEVMNDWRLNPGLSVASDLVSGAYTLGRFNVATDAARFVLSHANVPMAARRLATTYLAEAGVMDPGEGPAHGMRGPEGRDTVPGIPNQLHVLVRKTRDQIERYPRNPILWCNLARLYTSLGVQEKSSRAMRAALSMAPTNRFILRAASRLHLHQGDKDLAHRLVSNAENLKSDPWILAAEVATAAANHKTSKNLKYARKLLEDGRHSPFHTSELASALGTIELTSGNFKLGRKLVRSSLEQPSENSIAQAAWITRNLGLSPLDWGPRTTSYEANFWLAWRTADWATAISETQDWQNDEPFSSRPAIHLSYLASVIFENFPLAIASARQGLFSNQHDVTLYNNLAFSMAQAGEVVEAGKVIERAKLLRANPSETIFLTATEGLVAFRSQQPELGRLLYRRAISMAKSAGDTREHIARLYLAREELRIHSPHAEGLRQEALESAKKLTEPAYVAIIDKIRRFQAPK